jgi:AraC-like DNA-binding protein
MATSRYRWENAFSLIDPQINAEGIHLWPFDAACPVDVRFYRYDSDHHIRMNRHDYFEIFYLLAGELVCRIQERSFAMRSGDLAILSSTQYHTMHLPAQSKTTNHAKAAALYFLPEELRAMDSTSEEVEYLTPFLLQDAAFPHVIATRSGVADEIFSLIKRIHAELPATTTRARLAVKTYLRMILLLLVNHYAGQRGTVETFNRQQRAIEQLRPLFDYLETHYRETITIETAAAVMGMSQSHFMRLFKQVTGQPFVHYLNHFRVAKAQSLLATTTLSVADVSQAVGFCDQSYFGLLFRKLTRITPLQYKRQHQQP